MSADNLAT